MGRKVMKYKILIKGLASKKEQWKYMAMLKMLTCNNWELGTALYVTDIDCNACAN